MKETTNYTNILAGWVIWQLLIIGFMGGIAYNNKANCIPDLTWKSHWTAPLTGAALPLVFFVRYVDSNPACAVTKQ